MLRGNLWSLFEKISYSNNTTCINSNNIDLVEKSIIGIFDREEYSLIPKPPLIKNQELLIKEFLTRPWLINSLNVIALLKSNGNWITIKTSRPKLFCYTMKISNRVILSELAIESSCQAFHHHVEERRYGVLLEANISGETLASGYVDDHDTDGHPFFLNRLVVEPSKEHFFLLLDVPERFNEIGKTCINLTKLEKRNKEKYLEKIFNEQPEQVQRVLSEWKKLNASRFERNDEELAKLICSCNPFWYEDNLLYRAYAEPEKLEKNGVKLLFFKLKNLSTEEIWSPITSREDFGLEEDIPW